jgi:hypothetical protein
MTEGQFGSLRASALYCAPCGNAQPVCEERVKSSPGKELYHYLCARCGHQVGTREVIAPRTEPSAPSPSAPQNEASSFPKTL